MNVVSVAQAKAHLSELLARVETGEELQISRRGRTIARLVPEPKNLPSSSFDFDALSTFVDAQTASPGNSVVVMRTQDA
jgi:prevent-host-death family protein